MFSNFTIVGAHEGAFIALEVCIMSIMDMRQDRFAAEPVGIKFACVASGWSEDALQDALEAWQLEAALGESFFDPTDAEYADDDLASLLSDASVRERYLRERVESLENDARRRAREEAARERQSDRKTTRHVDQLKTELDIQRATSARLRLRAERAERAMRTLQQLSKAEGDPQQSGTAGGNDGTADGFADGRSEADAQMAEEVDRLRREVFVLKQRLAAQRLGPGDDDERPASPTPETLDDLAGWAAVQLPGRVVIASKAIRAARKSVFGDAALVYRVLQALADIYWPLRFANTPGASTQWSEFLAREKLACGPTGAAVDHHRTADAYRVPYGRRYVTLDMHVQGHSGRDESRAFRLYYHVHEHDRVVVVGHLCAVPQKALVRSTEGASDIHKSR